MVTIGMFILLIAILFFVVGSPFLARKITTNAKIRKKIHLDKIIECAGIILVLALFAIGC